MSTSAGNLPKSERTVQLLLAFPPRTLTIRNLLRKFHFLKFIFKLARRRLSSFISLFDDIFYSWVIRIQYPRYLCKRSRIRTRNAAWQSVELARRHAFFYIPNHPFSKWSSPPLSLNRSPIKNVKMIVQSRLKSFATSCRLCLTGSNVFLLRINFFLYALYQVLNEFLKSTFAETQSIIVA